MADQGLTYHEVLAALPAYATGILQVERQAAVDAYLQRQIALFQRLDELESAAGREETIDPDKNPPDQNDQPIHKADAFAQLMEGENQEQQLHNNPLLMRNAPQTYTDQRTGQRFVVPKRATEQGERTPRNFPAPPVSLLERLRRALWNVLAIATVIAVLLISAYQLQLQRQLTAITERAMLMSDAEEILHLAATSPTANSPTASPATMQATLFLRDQRALLTLRGMEALHDSQIYQFWYTTESGVQYNGGTIELQEEQGREQGREQLLIELPMDATTIRYAGLTIEAAGGSTTPTLPMLLESAFAENERESR